jgi:AcrR family transcriptional regulator
MTIPAPGETGTPRRTQLTRQRVIEAAAGLAHSDGTGSTSMRRLAQEPGAEAMSPCTHVRNTDDLLDAMADAVISQRPLSGGAAGWKTAPRQMALAAREVMLRHPRRRAQYRPARRRDRRPPGTSTRCSAPCAKAASPPPRRTRPYTSPAAAPPGSPRRSSAIPGDEDLDPQTAAQPQGQTGATHPHAAEIALAATHSGALGPCDHAAELTYAPDFTPDGLDQLQSS